MRIQAGEEVIFGDNLPSVLNEIITQKSEEDFVANASTQIAQEVCTVEIDDKFVVLIVLALINWDIDIAAGIEEINPIGPPPGHKLGIFCFVKDEF